MAGVCGATTINDFAVDWLATDGYYDFNEDGIVNYLDVYLDEDMSQTIKIGVMLQLGYSKTDGTLTDPDATGGNIPNWHNRGPRWFWDNPPTNSIIAGDRRYGQAKDTFNSAGVDFTVLLGGYVWGDTADNEKLNWLNKAVAISEALDNPVYNVMEFRDIVQFNGTPSNLDFATAVGLVGGGHNQGAVENIFELSSAPRMYTSDVSGVRLVFIAEQTGFGAFGVAERNWLQNTALDTDLPVMIFSADYLADRTALIGNTVPALNTAITNYEQVTDIIDAAGNVQAVFMGNTGWGIWDLASPTPNFTEAPRWTVNSVEYFPLDSAAMSPDATGNRYYIIEIVPNAVKTGEGLKANVSIEGFSLGTSRSKNLTEYLLA